MNKKGVIPTAQLFMFVIISFVIILLLGIYVFAFNEVTVALLAAPSEAGSVNFTNATANTIGQLNTGMLNQANIFAILLLFGLIISMVIVGYLTRSESPIVFMVFDIFIIIFAYIFATYISNVYETFLGSISFASTFTTNFNYASTLLLKLPIVVVVVGALIMIVTYSGIPKSKEEEVGGF